MQNPYLPAGVSDWDMDNTPCKKCDGDTYDEDDELIHTAVCPTLKDPDDYPEPD